MSDMIENKTTATYINVTELLMNISKDLAVVKNDVQHLKDETNNTNKSMSSRVTALEIELETLKHKDDKKDAGKYRTALYFILTSVGSMLLVKLPEIISAIINVFKG